MDTKLLKGYPFLDQWNFSINFDTAIRMVYNILLNKSLARILLSYPGLNEYEICYLV